MESQEKKSKLPKINIAFWLFYCDVTIEYCAPKKGNSRLRALRVDIDTVFDIGF